MSNKTRLYTEGAMMIALATALSHLKFFDMPYGGSITLEMIPLVVMGLRNGPKMGCFTAFIHGLIQMILGFSNVMYCATLLAQIGCILLDYLLAFSVLGLASVFAKPFKNNTVGFVFSSVVVGLLRFICSFFSGWLLWGSYKPDDFSSPIVYSLVYNSSYMLPNILIAAVVVGVLTKTSPQLFTPSDTH